MRVEPGQRPPADPEAQAPSPDPERRSFKTARRIGRGTRKTENWAQLMRFGLVGGSGYVVNLIVFQLLHETVGVHYILAACGAFVVAVSNNFFWNRHWTFGASDGHAGFQAARFFAVSLFGLALNLIALKLLIGAGMPPLAAQAVAVAIVMPINFIGNRLWTFV